jgi:predicted DNA-binding transcriptional regulator YafY
VKRSDRLFQLVQLLRARRVTTAEELADELSVSKRTIYRDIVDLQRSGVPVRGEAGVGYRLEASHELPPLTFTTAEIEALVAGARMISSWGDSELSEAARAAITKVEAVLPRELRRAVQGTPLYAPRVPWQGRNAELTPLRHAIAGRRKVRLSYVDASGEASERVVRPLGLFYWGKVWSLAAWCELRQAFRSFRPDRMAGIDVLPETFGDDGIDLDAFVAEMRQRDAEAGYPAG